MLIGRAVSINRVWVKVDSGTFAVFS